MNVKYEHKPAMTFIGLSVRRRDILSAPNSGIGSTIRNMLNYGGH